MLSAVLSSKTEKQTPRAIDTVARIASLRTLLVDTCQAFMGRVDARICYLINMLEKKDNPPGKKCVARIDVELQALKLKPYKGRRRDLKRIEKLIGEIEQQLGI